MLSGLEGGTAKEQHHDRRRRSGSRRELCFRREVESSIVGSESDQRVRTESGERVVERESV